MRRHFPDFDDESVGEARMLLSKPRGFILIARHQNHIAADRLLGFREWPIDHASSARAGDDAGFQFKRASIDCFTLGPQPIVPLIPSHDQILSRSW